MPDFVQEKETRAQKAERLRDLRPLAAEWLEQGLPLDLPCVLVCRAAQPDQMVRCTTPAAHTLAPSLHIAGWTVLKIAAASRLAADIVPVRA